MSPSPSIMIRTQVTPTSLARFLSSFKYSESWALSLKNWFTNSTASIPYSSRAILGKSRLSIFLAKSDLWSDHSAREILKSPILPAAGLPDSSAARATREPRPTRAPLATVPSRKRRRLILGVTHRSGLLARNHGEANTIGEPESYPEAVIDSRIGMDAARPDAFRPLSARRRISVSFPRKTSKKAANISGDTK